MDLVERIAEKSIKESLDPRSKTWWFWGKLVQAALFLEKLREKR